ncbi:Uncharacterised protein [Burkholderia pseudomallei]|nr:Uncharacterised protein [Burkholderia pseudomallei]
MVDDDVDSLFREIVDDGQALHAPAVGNPMICCSVKRFFMFVFFSENELY